MRKKTSGEFLQPPSDICKIEADTNLYVGKALKILFKGYSPQPSV
jgi:hypothetical protein